ncbi:hypothetical protein COB55_02295 [Candidatus Wolfebacteria bacterium]|nr:MAG: hypothetical protein COB55_02295 [Candidatus Wolfebacteria bacterium]
MSKKTCGGGCSSVVYGLGFIGAMAYYISAATGLVMGLVGFFKSLVWPGILVFELLTFLLGVV